MPFRVSFLFLFSTTLGMADIDARAIVRRSVDADEQNWKIARAYEFSERVDARRLGADGKLKSKEIRVYEVVLLDGSPFRRLSGRDDRPLPPIDEAKEQDRFLKNRKDRQKETVGQRSSRIATYERRPEWQREAWRELPEVFDFRITGEDAAFFVIETTPRAGYRPKSRTADVLIRMKAKLWIDKHDFHLAKAEVEAIENIWVGMFLVRLAKGSRAAFEYTKLDTSVWMPQRVRVSASICLGLMKTLNIEQDMRYGRPSDSAGLRAKQMGKILTLNSGSSNTKFATFATESLERTFSATKAVSEQTGGTLLDWLEEQLNFESLTAVGHRIVHGMNFAEPLRVTQQVLEELRRISPYDPEHMPPAIAWIEGILSRYPALPQVVCFDTAFHRDMPRVAKMIPIPRRFEAMGARRYGFHGLSYEFLLWELARVTSGVAAQGRLVFAHLGNGASLAAVHRGKSVDTSMGFTPAGGVPMGTRSGDLDPGIAWFLMSVGGLSLAEFHHLTNHEAGLLGVSASSSDMRHLLTGNHYALEAVDLFCYQVRKCIGSLAAAMGGIDILVFSGGIGENSPEVRTRVCAELGFLGVSLHHSRNGANEALISTGDVTVRVIRTNEELMIARHVCKLLELS
jgi:acetate kinase